MHCTATSQKTSIAAIQRYWKINLGWKMPGYHFIIMPDGLVVPLLPIEQVSNGVAGFNSVLINIAYLGGVDANNKPLDNRTPAQKGKPTKITQGFKKTISNGSNSRTQGFSKRKKSVSEF